MFYFIMKTKKLVISVSFMCFTIFPILCQDDDFIEFEETTSMLDEVDKELEDDQDIERTSKQIFHKTNRNMTIGNVIFFTSNSHHSGSDKLGLILEQKYGFKYYNVRGLLEEEMKYNRVNVSFIVDEVLKSEEDVVPGNLLNRLLYETLKSRYETLIIDGFPRDLQDLWVVKKSLIQYINVIMVVYLSSPYDTLLRNYLHSLPVESLMGTDMEPIFDKFHRKNDMQTRLLFPVLREYREFDGFVLANGSYRLERIAHDLINYWRLYKICGGFRRKMMKMWTPKPLTIIF